MRPRRISNTLPVRRGRACVCAGRAMYDEPFAISQLIRIACIVEGLRSVESALSLGEASEAELVALALPALCELSWVLSQGYKIPKARIAEAMRRLVNSANVAVNRPAAEAGLACLEAGGDFADGVIAYEGNWLGADIFVSFDQKAVKLMEARGESVRLLS